MINGKPRHSQSQGSVERGNRDIEDMIAAWQDEKQSRHWSKSLGDIQFQKNSRFHRGIGRSPYEALFGTKPRNGIKNLNIEKEVTDHIDTEEDLNKILNKDSVSDDDHEEDDNQDKNILNKSDFNENEEVKYIINEEIEEINTIENVPELSK